MTWRAGSLLQAGRDGKMRRNIPTPSVLLCFDFSKNRLTATTFTKINPNMFATSVFASSPKKNGEKLTPKSLAHLSPTRPEVFERFSISPVVRQHWKQILGRLCWGLQGGQGVWTTRWATLFADKFFLSSFPTLPSVFLLSKKSCLIIFYPYKIWNWHTKSMDVW